MCSKSIGTSGLDSVKIFEKAEQGTLNSIRKMLPDEAIDKACREIDYHYRQRVLTPVVTVLHMILAALWPEESFNASWQVIWSTVVSRFPQCQGTSPSRGTVSNARTRLPLALWERLFAFVSHQAQALSSAYDTWRGHRVVLLDGSCVSMPCTPALFEAFGTGRSGYGLCKFPLARLVALSLANTMTVVAYSLGPYGQDETTLTRPMLKDLKKGDLLVADRHFAGAHLYHGYQSSGLEYLTRAHQRLNISRIKRIASSTPNDFVGWLHIGKKYRRQDPTLPVKMRARFIQVLTRIRGQRRLMWLTTSLLDFDRYPSAELAELYGRRWRIETLFREVKITLSADVLRSQRPDGIRKETAARLIALNVIRSIALEAAVGRDLEDPLRISFVHTVRAIVAFSPALATEPFWKLPIIYQAMLEEIASHLVPDRPGRNEPRMLRRERKHYPTLSMTRQEWRTSHAA
jgi:hypothetical protein